jgi:asparagine synthase (glutamine-hydrolysing)
MCGILGIWHRDGRPVDLRTLRWATDTLRHRGPDDEGYLLVDTRSGRTVLCGGDHTPPQLALPRLEQFMQERFDLALGFRRLAIIDLSPAGHQPMPYLNERFWLVFNGEVYNYVELRAELASLGHTFRTGTDTEVILAAYSRWSAQCLQRFNGMWGFAIWDNSARQLFLARDRFGVKPLYMVNKPDGTFAFASEIKALLAPGVADFVPSPLAIARYVAQSRFPDHRSGHTFFQGVRALPPAHYALVSKQGSTLRRFWELPNPRHTSHRHADANVEDIEGVQGHYRQLFTDAVRLRLRADVAVGTCLSGGVDSSSIVAVAGKLMREEHAVSLERLGERQQTFSAVYDLPGPWDERRYIRLVVESTGAGGNYIVPTDQRLWDELERLVWHQDEPFQSTSIFAQWCVMDLARQRGATVLLDGQGADEVLGGYRPFAVWLAQLLRSGQLGRAVREAQAVRRVTGLDPLPLLARALAVHMPDWVLVGLRSKRLREAVLASGLKPDLRKLLLEQQAVQRESYSDQRDLNHHLARLIVEDSLPNLLRYEDRNSMAFSIEARLPFLDYRLVEFVFTRAAHLRIRDGWTKWIQRTAVEDLLPAEVVWRRDKVGFETPERRWLCEGRDRLLHILSGAASTAGQYLDLPVIQAQLPGLLERGETGKVWRWVNVALWLSCFGRPT